MHTPGPWRAKPADGEIVLNGSSIYAVRDVPSDRHRHNPDDIRLMAHAPELLAACHALLAIVEQEYADDPEPGELRSWKRVIKQATEAIAKAEGRPCEQDRPVD